jgi:hypothetical protein
VRRLLPWIVKAVLLFAALPGFSQVIRLAGGASTIADTQGAAVTLYQADTTTQTSLGYAHGIHLGASREVRSGSASLTVGDSMLSLSLPTDLPGAARTMSVRGALLQNVQERRAQLASEDNMLPAPVEHRMSGSAFAGFTGDGYNNAFFSSVQPSHAIAIASGRLELSRTVEVSAVAARGTRSSLLTSAEWAPSPVSAAAITAGWSGVHAVAVVSAHSSGQSWSAAATYTSGALRLQPEPSLSSLSLERIGWNLIGSKRLGTHLWFDAARHEYNSADAIDQSAAGVTAGRSTLYEGGSTMRFGHAEAGARFLQSISGSQTSGGIVLLSGWTATKWAVRGTAVRNTSPGSTSATSSATIDTTERISQHLRMTQGTTFANGAPSFDFGGSYEDHWGAVTISHQETFVPFGYQSGFHRILAMGVRFHLGETEIVADQISGRGLSTMYNVAVDSFHGDSLGVSGMPSSHMASIAKYALEGRVMTTSGTPVRGAAVSAGTQTAYTDSDGHYLIRFSRTAPVKVSVVPEAFLTPESYRTVSEPQWMVPEREGASQVVDLQVERCLGCVTNAPPQEMQTPEATAINQPTASHGMLWHAGRRVLALAQRMIHGRPLRTGTLDI